jgi:hypothetical protein
MREVPKFKVLTHLLVDRVYPGVAAGDAQVAATVEVDDATVTVGTVRRTAAGGQFVYLGARPRDDQSGSTADAPRTLFQVLRAMGAYTDNAVGWTENASNIGDLLVCESPNGAVSIAHHYYKVKETWAGGFSRPKDEKFDETVLPPLRLELKDRSLGPYHVTYEGQQVVMFRMEGTLVAFAGTDTCGITTNGREFRLTDAPVNVTFAPLPSEQLASGIKRGWIIEIAHADGKAGELVLRLPFEVPAGAMWASDPRSNGRGVAEAAVCTSVEGGTELRIPAQRQGIPLYLFVAE